jgi:hypothetical protein
LPSLLAVFIVVELNAQPRLKSSHLSNGLAHHTRSSVFLETL